MEFKRQVQGYGPTAPGGIVVLGEAPSNEELAQGVPFVGPAGQELRRRIVSAGLSDTQIRFENVLEFKLTDNDIGPYYADQRNRSTENAGHVLKEWFADCQRRLAALKPSVVVACGETAMQAATGLSKIGKHQCFVYPGPGYQVVPAYHPSYILRSYSEGMWLTHALKKAVRIKHGAKDLDRTFHTAPTCDEVLQFLAKADNSPTLAFDIECIKATSEITCVGFALSATEAMCIPLKTKDGSYWNHEMETAIWWRIQQLLNSGKELLMHNFMFEAMVLSKWGIELGSNIYDSMLAANLLHPEIAKGLDDVARQYSLCANWDGDMDWGITADPTPLWRYNAMDCCITFEVMQAQKRELEHRKLFDFYRERVASMYAPVYELCARGWNVDHAEVARLDETMSARMKELEAEMSALAAPYWQNAKPFNARSPQQVKELFHRMDIPIPTRGGDESTDIKAKIKIWKKYPQYEIIPKLLEYGKASKLRSTYVRMDLDPDNRLRFGVNIGGTKSGRFSSAQTPWGTGCNSQNIPSRDKESPYNFRQIVIPDPGKVLFSVDLKQADARVVAWLANETRMLQIFDSGGDIHSQVASLIFREDIKKLPEAEYKRKRYLGKKSVHSFNYGQGENTFIETCLVEGDIVLTYAEAKQIRENYFTSFARVGAWQAAIRDQLRKTRRLVSPHGRERIFYGRYNDEMVREGLSFIPQATVADSINEAWRYLWTQKARCADLGLEILQQGHDSLLIQANVETQAEARRFIDEAFASVKFVIGGLERNIPHDVSTGMNWRDCE